MSVLAEGEHRERLEKLNSVGDRAAVALSLGTAVVAVGGLALAEAFDVTLLLDSHAMIAGGRAAAWLGVLLLVADIVLPVPSSAVMVAHGALFGIVPGAALSLLGRTGNAVVGVLFGRGAASLLSRRTRGESAPDGGRGAQLVGRWGVAAVVLTRPIPVLAESTLVAAAAIGLPPAAVIAAAILGALPEAVLYAVAGDVAATYASGTIVFVTVIGLAVGAWVVGARIQIRRAEGPPQR